MFDIFVVFGIVIPVPVKHISFKGNKAFKRYFVINKISAELHKEFREGHKMKAKIKTSSLLGLAAVL